MSEIIEIFKASGLIEYWHRRNFRWKKHEKDGNEKRSLSICDLEGCFLMFGSGTLMSLMAFCGELMLKRK
jgi:hypothetical protein